MEKNVFTSLAVTFGLWLGVSGVASALTQESLSSDPAEKGTQIAEESKLRDVGYGDSQAIMKMVLTNAYGDTSTRELRMRTLERTAEEEGDWSLIVFDKPRDVEGTALLTHAGILTPDSQWMYLPKLGRVKRISSANKSGPFMGSEFAFEDFSSQEPGKFSHLWLRDEPCPDVEPAQTCFVTERKPLYEKSGYTRQVVWSDTADFQPLRIDYYDRKNALLKTLTFSDYKLYLDKHWRALDLYMVNHNTDKKTRLTWQDYEFNLGLDPSDFDKNSLKRIR